MKPFVLSVLSVLILTGCADMTPAQRDQWNATGAAIAQRAADIALDEAAARLRATRDNK